MNLKSYHMNTILQLGGILKDQMILALSVKWSDIL